MKLTLRKIEELECAAGKKDVLIFDEERRGLALRVTAAAKKGKLDGKSYLAQYTFAGRKRRVPLGSAAGLSLDAARKATAAILGDVAQGRDPAAERKKAAHEARRKADEEALTLAALIDQWESNHLRSKSDKYATEAVRALRFAFEAHLNRPAADLSRRIVVRVLDEMAAAGKSSMANSTVAYGRACFSWAIKRGSLADSPFHALPRTAMEKRERVLTDDELRVVWRATEAAGTFNAIVRALILTGQRRKEVAGITWGELAADRSVWTIPAERAKNGVAHMVPLSPQMRAHIEARGWRPKAEEGKQAADPAPTDFVFPGRDGPFNGFSKAKAALDEESGVTGWRLHDLRRTLATGLQRLGVRLEVTEAVLNHISGSRAGIVGIYQRHDYAVEKRAALHAWGAHVGAVVEARPFEGNVTPMRRDAIA